MMAQGKHPPSPGPQGSWSQRTSRRQEVGAVATSVQDDNSVQEARRGKKWEERLEQRAIISL